MFKLNKINELRTFPTNVPNYEPTNWKIAGCILPLNTT